jgi:hypothetical protein
MRTFTFRNGVAQTGDLEMTTPTFNITGVGMGQSGDPAGGFSYRAQGRSSGWRG